MGAITREATTALIFAGGQATRMGGVNKGLVPLRGRALILHVLDAVRPQTSAQVISANRDAEVFEGFGVRVISDRVKGFPGPMAALEAASAPGVIETEWVLTAPCDAPYLPGDMLERFAEAQRKELEAGRDPDTFVAETENRIQSAVACVRASCLHLAAESIRNDERRLRRWYMTLGAVATPFPDESRFANLNTGEELEAAQ
ncbi:molybdenum cofactor guanylyltransferase MobA [Sutterella sp.]|uniref:molybdenum cofactor guanylyltransferase MobA n=1 Tax=Sutterella sp. TaxID=1981025 RepID=UPI0026DFF54E|nr:molybdenum cofactor guanylyltransferase MobA [Sutterella sp.]MDO5531507.1 molybdenum cofactor guanylyltransferase MobA [Sutterella sp.]